ncbi:mitotic-spindle organizing protein 2A [Trichonephila clavipes]|nr:mitotic-spindle organizing protein 2A [Trichonephila clavipes]
MACERKLLESEATTGFFVLLGTKGKKETLEWCMKANLIASRYECPRCKKEMRLQERKGTVDGYEWRCRSQSKDNPHDVVRIVRKGTWFSESKLAITTILCLTRYWFGKSMNAFVVNDDLTVTTRQNRTASGTQIQRLFLLAPGRRVSSQTICKGLRADGLYTRKPILLTARHRKARRKRAAEHRGENVSQVAETVNSVYGADTATVNYAPFLFRRFHAGIFDVKDTPRTGRPIIENVDKNHKNN